MLSIAMLTLIVMAYCWLDLKSITPKRINQKALITSERKIRHQKEQRRSALPEPYDVSLFLNNPQNFDIQGFWQSYRKHKQS